MPEIKIPAKELEERVELSSEFLIEEQFIGQNRWTILCRYIFRHTDGKAYAVYTRRAATEDQDEEPFGGDDPVKCIEVRQVENVVRVWEPV
jgi:hypothetical protein